MNKNTMTYICVIILSAVILYFWNIHAMSGAELFNDGVKTANAKIISVESKEVTTFGEFESIGIVYSAMVMSGELKDETVRVYQEHNSRMSNMKIAEPGDKVVIKNYPNEEIGADWAIDNYLRTGPVLFLVMAFVILVIILGRTKGLRTAISLIYTCVAVFAVFIPSVLSGKNIYLNVSFVCIFIIVMTLLIVSGISKKTLAASLGCIGGVLAAAAISAVFSDIMNFSGYTDEHSYYLTSLSYPIDLGAIAFSAIIIGAVGAVMDVAMSMSSSLWELRCKVHDISFKSLVSSGLAIGRDMMGTMANTLVLAYVGSSLSSVLIFVSYADSAADLFNKEIIANEVLQAVAGSIGILLSIPVTAFVCGVLYTKRQESDLLYSNSMREKMLYKTEIAKSKCKKSFKEFRDFFAKNRLK